MATIHSRQKESDLLTGIAPIFRIDRNVNEAKLVGTGFGVTEFGHLITAWHVVDENIGEDGVDIGDDAKGPYTYNYFKLKNLEIDSFDQGQGIQRAAADNIGPAALAVRAGHHRE